jgi:hypothetical protein
MKKETQGSSGPKGIVDSKKSNYISNGEKTGKELQLHFYI